MILARKDPVRPMIGLFARYTEMVGTSTLIIDKACFDRSDLLWTGLDFEF